MIYHWVVVPSLVNLRGREFDDATIPVEDWDNTIFVHEVLRKVVQFVSLAIVDNLSVKRQHLKILLIVHMVGTHQELRLD
jgi:hypothetical protein